MFHRREAFFGFCPYVMRFLEWLRQNDNPVGKLVGRKMVDKIALLLVPMPWNCFGEEFCNTYVPSVALA